MTRATGHVEEASSPLRYAARIARYIADPSTIRARTANYYGPSRRREWPTIEQCRAYREQYNREREKFRELAENRTYGAHTVFACGHPTSEENTVYRSDAARCLTCHNAKRAQAEAVRADKAAKRAAEEQQRERRDISVLAPIDNLFPHERIVARACALFKMEAADMFSKSRLRAHVRPRFLVMLAIHERGRWSLPQIANYIGLSCHTTVRHAIAQAKLLIEREPIYAEHLAELRKAGGPKA